MLLGVALYWITDDDDAHHTPYFHWALALTNRNAWDAAPMTVYQIHGSVEEGYQKHFSSASLTRDSESSTFCGVVDLQLQVDTDYTEDQRGAFADFIDQVIRTHGAEEPAKRQAIPGPQGWTCAAWVLNVLHDLEDAGGWDLPTGVTWNKIYETVLGRGVILYDLRGHLFPYPILPLVSGTKFTGVFICLILFLPRAPPDIDQEEMYNQRSPTRGQNHGLYIGSIDYILQSSCGSRGMGL